MELFSIEIDKTLLISGLEWQALSGPLSLVKEKQHIASELNATLHAEFSNGVETLVGFLPDELAVGLPKKLHSLPGLLAGVPNIASYCVLIVEEGDVALLAALQNGQPAPGFDGYGPIEEIIETARNFINMAPAGVTVYGNCRLLNASPLTLETIVASSTTKKQALLKKMPNSSARYVMAAGVLFILALGANFAYNQYQKAERIKKEKLSYVNVDAVYQSNVAEVLKTAIPAKAAYSLLNKILGKLVVDNHGWAFATVLCQQGGCTYTWKNENGLNSSFVPPADASPLSFSDKGDVLVYQVPYKQAFQVGIDPRQATTLDAIRRDITGEFQKYYNLDVSSQFYKTDVFGVPPGLPGNPSKTYQAGTFTIKGPWYANDVLNNLPDAASFDALELTLGTDQQLQFTATGKYYVK